MAQKKIKLELSVVEAGHLGVALNQVQDDHEGLFGRPNPAITRIQKKLDAAASAAEKAEDAKEVTSSGGDDEPAADAG